MGKLFAVLFLALAGLAGTAEAGPLSTRVSDNWAPCTCTNCVPGSGCDCAVLEGFPQDPDRIEHAGRVADFSGFVGLPPSGSFALYLRVGKDAPSNKCVIAECELDERGH